MPSWVYAEANRITALPNGPAKVRDVKRLITKLRRSELRKVAAINVLVNNQERLLSYLRKRGQK